MFSLPTHQIETGAAPYHHGDLRRALIDAALDRLADGSIASIGLRELARGVGVSSAAPYRHFRNKAALLAAVAIEGFDRFRATLEAARESSPDEAQLAAMSRAYVQFARDHRALFQLMFSPEADRRKFPALKAAAQAAFAPLAQVAARESKDAPLETAIGAWALAHGLSNLLLDDDLLAFDVERTDALVGMVTRSFVAGLRAREA